MAISKVIQWSNGMVTVFDGEGNQMPEFQGKRSEAVAKLKLLRSEFGGVQFRIGSWEEGTLPSSREQFFSEGWD